MNILVYDVAASESGALTVLYDFFQEVLENPKDDIHWMFVVSTPELPHSDVIRVIRFPWVKKSWLHRLWFEHFVAPKVAKKNKADLIFSLQNITVPHMRIPQVVYVHQSLPFVAYRFKFMENRLFWIYQNIIGRKIIKSIRQAKKTIVQTYWMQKACMRHARITKEQIEVVSPLVRLENIKMYIDVPSSRRVFFYPAGPFEYKNHMLILKACERLNQIGVNDYKVVFTISGKENSYTKDLLLKVNIGNLPIVFMGNMSREDVATYYSKSVLLFPSRIETVGLPMLEARSAGAMIFAANTVFGNEILEQYSNVHFFEENDADMLTHYMLQCLKGEMPYTHIESRVTTSQNSILSILINQYSTNRR